ncbi:hypothetical protein [Erwinia tracheiphila]|nr:hypothetical protein [Erwinia tracheiphila]
MKPCATVDQPMQEMVPEMLCLPGGATSALQCIAFVLNVTWQ